MLKSAEAKKLIGAKGVGGDRLTLKLRDEDEILINEISKVNDNIVVVYIGGSAIDMSSWESNVPSIIFSWYSGMEGGNALAKIIYGDVNPSGKLPLTIASSVGQLKMFYNHKHSMYYRDYAIYNNRPLYYFGFGLSYTKFEISEPKLKSLAFTKDKLRVSVDIKNVGEISGDEIVQLYISDKYSSITRPIKELKAFKRVSLKSGESKEITFELG